MNARKLNLHLNLDEEPESITEEAVALVEEHNRKQSSDRQTPRPMKELMSSGKTEKDNKPSFRFNSRGLNIGISPKAFILRLFRQQ